MTGAPTVVVMRSAAAAAPLVERLAARGIEASAVVVQAPAPPNDGGRAMAAAVAALERYSWLALTSTRAVQPLVDAGLTPVAASAVRVAAVGPATGRTLRAAGFDVALVPHAATAADLAAAFPPPQLGERVLAPLAERAAPDLVDGLLAVGYAVDRVDAYRMAPVEPSAAELAAVRRATVAVVAAPSTAERLAGLVGTGRPTVVAIGPRTAAAADTLGFSVVEASATDTAALAAATEAAVVVGARADGSASGSDTTVRYP